MANRNQMLVEGADDLHAIVGLMRHHVPWPDRGPHYPVEITYPKGVDVVLSASLSTRMEGTWDTYGIVVDADGDPSARWDSFCHYCRPFFPTIPALLPANGLIVFDERGRRLGFWVMPDCSSPGMIETFARDLVPAEDRLWNHALQSFSSALAMGAACRDPHHDKARIHTWLAWQDPPGQRLGIALTKRILNPTAPSATPFITWFKTLYGL